MSGTLILQASTDEDLSEQTTDRVRAELEDVVEQYEAFEDPQTYFQEKKDVTTYGFSVKTNLSELANKPGNGRYLGMFIVGSDELISEKFISNPAIKQEKGRDNLAFSILKQNGVDQVLLRESPDKIQKQIVEEIDLDYAESPEHELEDLRDEITDL